MPADYSSLKRHLLSYWKFDNDTGNASPQQWDLGSKRFHIGDVGYSIERLFGPPYQAGKIGRARKSRNEDNTSGNTQITRFSNYGATAVPVPFTFGGWFKFTANGATPPALYAPMGFEGADFQWLNDNTVKFRFQDSVGNSASLTSAPIALDEWHFILCSISSGWVMSLRIDNGTPIEQQFTGIGTAPLGRVEFRCLHNWVDDSFIYGRILDQEEQGWLWNEGNGLSIDDFGPVVDETGCQAIPCCETDPFGYAALSATTAAVAAAPTDTCPQGVSILIQPPGGSCVILPSHVSLYTATPNTILRYTTDGSEPTEDSTLYVTPFQITSPNTIVKAKAFIPGCPASETFIAAYQICPPQFEFKFRCLNPADDKVGIWDVWTPNSVQDYHWTLGITTSEVVSIKRIEIYQTNAAGFWNTGQAWATDQYNNPPEGPPGFNTFPLAIFNPAQVNSAYTADFSGAHGTFGVGSHTLELYGNKQAALFGFFKLILTLNNGKVFYKLIDPTVCDPPPPCFNPAAPTLTPACAGIDVTFAETVGSLYRIYRYSESCGQPVPVLIASGTVGTNPQTYSDTAAIGTLPGLCVNCAYSYYVSIKYAACPDYLDSPAANAQRAPHPCVSITASALQVCAGTSVTVSWNSYNIAAGGACGSSDVSITGGIGTQSGNAPGSQVIVINSTTTFTIEGCNSCGTVNDSVTVTVSSGDCDGTLLVLGGSLSIANYDEENGNHWENTALGGPVNLTQYGFNGVLVKDPTPSSCFYQWLSETSSHEVVLLWDSLVCKWRLELRRGTLSGDATVAWYTYSSVGNPTDPRGSYDGPGIGLDPVTFNGSINLA